MKKHFLLLILFLSVVFGIASSCRRNTSNEKRFELRGKVVSVEPEKRLVTIAHEEVKDYMPSMTMPFALHDEYYLKTIAAGDDISATLVVDGSHSWLEGVAIVRQTVDMSAGAPAVAVEGKAGDEIPDYTLVNQDGKQIKLSDYRGKTVMLTFIYTRCPIPEYCALMSKNFAQVDRKLQEQADLYEKTHLLSISIDPDFDSPKVLKSYGAAYTERYQEETFEHWEFASGSKEQVKEIAQFFGLRYFEEKNEILHGLRTAIITPAGKIFKVYRDNEWKPEDAVAEIVKAAGNG